MSEFRTVLFRLAILTGLLLLIGLATFPPDPNRQTLRALQGTWEVVELRADEQLQASDQVFSTDLLKGAKVDFNGSRMVFTFRPSQKGLTSEGRPIPEIHRSYQIQIDATRLIPAIRLIALNKAQRGEVSLGLFQLQDDRLTLGLTAARTWPTSFATPPGSGMAVYRMKRAEK